jgi:hypothetical protein
MVSRAAHRRRVVGDAMVSRAAIAGLVTCLAVCLAACVRRDYQCASDADCDVGVAGRCELDRRCTAVDPTCETNRRYSDHSGPQSGACFDDRIAPINRCAAGQPPAAPDPCTTAVCDALPSCCSTGWSEACVRQAQLTCSDLVCDTRIAITANKPGRSELWDLRWDGATWTARLDPRHSVLAWLAPAPGTIEPRLAGFTDDALVVDDLAFAVAANRSYLEATSVDFDRDGRATAALAFTDGRGVQLEIAKLDDGSSRPVATAAATRLSWGDVDHDGFPDGIAGAGASIRYHLLSNTEDADHQRELDDRVVTNVTGGAPSMPGALPAIRGFDWLDVDRDGQLDVVAFGYSVDVHLGRGDAIGPGVLFRLDCDPPATAGSCDGALQAEQSFAGAALTSPNASALVVAGHPARSLHRAELRAMPAGVQVLPYRFPPAACGAACPPIVAVVVRDLDGDHALDVIAIDADLQVFTGLATEALQLRAALKLPTVPAAPGFAVVRTSVTGAPR